MSDENKKDEPKVQADNNGIAVGSLSIGGSVEGTMIVGNDNTVTTGYTAEQVAVLITQIRSTFQPKPFDGRCPYKGLDVFEEEDAELFFGREKLVDDLISRVKDSRTVFVTGPSGSGKSSLVRAGLIHALKQGALKGSERWLYATMKPGRDPIGELGRVVSSLASSTNPEDEIRDKAMKDATIFARWCEIALKEGRGKRLVLFIDQFEEVFTQINNEEERVAFLNLLTHAATIENGRAIILFSMRSDFVSNCATYPQLNALLNQQFVQIGAMQPEELVSAIAQPALRVGLRIDPDLIAQIINEMKGEPGALPLMQFALKDLFDSQQEKSGVPALTLNDYLQRGGIHKALERHADDSFSKLSKNEQELARSIFSGLIEIGRGTQDTRRTALFDELIPANTKAADVEAIVQKLADARLITTNEQAGKDTVTISHEKLIDAWPWLKKLVNENRDAIALQNEIASDAQEWNEHHLDASYLYIGARLINVREQLYSKKLVLSGTASEFVQTGLARQKRTQIALIGGVSTIIVFLIVAVIIFAGLTREAQKQTNIALARQLAAQAQSIYAPSKQEIAVLLSLRSMELFPVIDAAQIIQTSTITHSFTPMTHDSYVTSVVFSPDGNYVVSGSGDGTARVWEAATGKEVARMTHDNEVTSVAFSPDGKYAVSGSGEGTARVWEATTGKEVARMTHDDKVTSVAFSPDGNYVVSGSLDGTARVWEATIGVEVARMTHDEVTSVAFSPDGKYVVSAGCDKTDDNGNCQIGTARVWETATDKEIARMGDGIASAAFSPNGKYIVSAGASDGLVCVWEATTGKEVFCQYAYGSVSSVAFSPDGYYVVAGADGATAFVWDSATGDQVAQMSHDTIGSGGAVTSVAFSPDGKYVVSGSRDKSARVWEAATGVEVARMTHDIDVTSVAFSPDGKYVVSGSLDDTVRVWEASTGVEGARVDLGWVNAFSPDGKYAVSSSDDKSARVWNVETGAEVARLTLDDYLTSAAFSPSGKYIVSGDKRTARVWEVSSGTEVARMTHNSGVNSVAFSPDGKYVVSAGCGESNDTGTCIIGTARVWKAASGEEVARMTHDDEVTSVAFSPDGKYVVSGSIDGTARVWEAATGKEVARMTHDDEITSVAFSPDGKYIVSGSRDKSARVWEAANGNEVARMTHDIDVVSVAFSPDGKYVGSAGCDADFDGFCYLGTARVWEATTGVEVARMTNDDRVNFIAFNSNGKYVFSGSTNIFYEESRYSVWIYRPKDLIANACSRVTRNLTRAEWTKYIGNALPYKAVCENLPIELEPTLTVTP